MGVESRTWDTGSPGPRLLVLGGVHGDEPCGTEALTRLWNRIDDHQVGLRRGALTLVPRANPLACARGTREGERNLNRSFVPLPRERWSTAEDETTVELAALVADHDVLLDLHSASTPTDPFAMIGLPVTDDLADVLPDAPPAGEPFGPAPLEAALAGALGVDVVVEGWLDAYAAALPADADPAERAVAVGTNEYARTRGVAALTVECGQHDDPAAVAVAWEITRRTLAHLGLIDAVVGPPVRPRVLRTTAVVRKEHDGDAFVREWHAFEPVRAGEIIGERHDGVPVPAAVDGAVMFPDDDADVGEEWFYLASDSDRSVTS
jgi:predicted deacylase